MNQTRKLLTLLAMVAFIVIIFNCRLATNRLTMICRSSSVGASVGIDAVGFLAILIVIYAGLFAIASDDQFLTRHRRGLNRLAIAWLRSVRPLARAMSASITSTRCSGMHVAPKNALSGIGSVKLRERIGNR
jgi:hypothetical protein